MGRTFKHSNTWSHADRTADDIGEMIQEPMNKAITAAECADSVGARAQDVVGLVEKIRESESDEAACDSLADSIPDMLTLTRTVTQTKYSENWEHEWLHESKDLAMSQDFSRNMHMPWATTQLTHPQAAYIPVSVVYAQFDTGCDQQHQYHQQRQGRLNESVIHDEQQQGQQYQPGSEHNSVNVTNSTRAQVDDAIVVVPDQKLLKDCAECLELLEAQYPESGDAAMLRQLLQLCQGRDMYGQVVASLRGKVLSMTLRDKTGCLIVQLAIQVVLQVADLEAATNIVRELRGHVCEAAQSPFGNYVIQQLVTRLPPSLSSFVVDELLVGDLQSVVRTRCGCRVLCRVFEKYANENEACMIAEVLLQDVVALSRHNFAHYVIECILEHGHEHYQWVIVEALARQCWVLAIDKSGSHVIDKGLKYCADGPQQALAASFVNLRPDDKAKLGRNQNSGPRVVKTLKKQGYFA